MGYPSIYGEQYKDAGPQNKTITIFNSQRTKKKTRTQYTEINQSIQRKGEARKTKI
jgi:hypothetical protein